MLAGHMGITLTDGLEGKGPMPLPQGLAVCWLPLPLENCPQPNGSHIVWEFKRLERVPKATDMATSLYSPW